MIMDMRYCRYFLLALFFAGFTASLAGGSKITSEGNLIVEGGGEAVVDTAFSKEAFAADFEITPVSYPLSSEKNPAFELIVNPPVSTEKIRFVSNDRGAHITEIRLFEPGMPRYPDILAEGARGLDVPNFALGAKVTASSRYSDTRDEGGAVDGSLAFGSRWTSRGKAPHRLTIDMGKERAIGCIQMVSGYLSGTDWESTARDFHFQKP